MLFEHRKASNYNVFVIPYHFQEASEQVHAWGDVEKPEQVIFDMRTEKEKQCVQKNRNAHTFRNECDVWQDRPQLMSFETVPYNNFRPTVHYLKGQNRIVHITVDYENPQMASFVFFEGNSYYELPPPAGRV